MKKQEKPKSMGMFSLTDLSFVRKFRWTLAGKYISESFMKTVNIDHKHKLITFESYEAVGRNNSCEALSWAHNLKSNYDETLTFTTYDGCGTKLYQIVFSGLDLVEHTTSFDYENSDISTRKVSVTYQHEEIENGPNKVPTYVQKMKVGKKEFKVVADEPRLRMDEVGLTHLNASVKIAGSAEWNPMTIRFLEPVGVSPLMEPQDIEIRTYKDNVLVQTWCLSDAWTSKASGMCWLIRFNNVKYKMITSKLHNKNLTNEIA